MGVRGAPGRAGLANRVAEMSQRALGLTHKVLGGGPWTNLSGTVVVRGDPWGSGVLHGGHGCLFFFRGNDKSNDKFNKNKKNICNKTSVNILTKMSLSLVILQILFNFHSYVRNLQTVIL